MTNSGLKFHYLNLSLRSRLLLYFVLVSIIPILVIGFISYTISGRVIRERAAQFSGQMVKQVTGEVNNLLLDSYKVSAMVTDDMLVQEVLRKPLNANIAKLYSTDLMLDTRLAFIQSSYRNEFFGFYVIGTNGGKYKSNFYSAKSGDLTATDWFRRTVRSKGPVWFGAHRGSFAVETVGQPMVSVGFPIIDKATGRVSGAVLLDIEEGLIAKLIGSRLGKTGYMYLVDGADRVISHPDKTYLGIRVRRNDFTLSNIVNTAGYDVLPKKTEQSIVMKQAAINGWELVGVLPIRELNKESWAVGWTIAWVLLCISCLAISAAWAIARSVANPIKQLMELMKKVEAGDLSVSMDVKYQDEVGQLGHSFNIMVEEIKKLMDRVYWEQKELRKTELKALQAQINPHFLYNTLDSIIWLSRAKRFADIDKMATALTRLFRIGISRGRDMITIAEEIEHIRSYLTIQNIRYKNKFSYEIMVPEALQAYQTLKLILQPLVENAIYHGIKMKRELGKITVSATERDGLIVLVVRDTGIGMTPQQLTALENTLQNASGEKIESYGVKNVNERIKIFFGSDYGLTFHSEYGVGTSVEVRIPKILEVEENVKSSLG